MMHVYNMQIFNHTNRRMSIKVVGSDIFDVAHALTPTLSKIFLFLYNKLFCLINWGLKFGRLASLRRRTYSTLMIK